MPNAGKAGSKPKATKQNQKQQPAQAKKAKANKAPGLLSGLGGIAGGMLGPTGSAVGSLLGKGLANIIGFGDYTVSENTITKEPLVLSDTVPQFNVNEHRTIIKHREYITDLKFPAAPANFNLASYAINPGNANLFPWLSSIARRYQQYEFLGAVFEYKTMSSDYAASGPLGTVVMATNYNANDKSYPSKIAMENSEFACSTKPSHSVLHPIECNPRERVAQLLYVNDPSYDNNTLSDKRLYHYGTFQVATQGLPGTTGTTLGELWVTYEVALYKPIVSASDLPGVSLTSTFQPTVAAAGGMAFATWTDAKVAGSTPGLIGGTNDTLPTTSLVSLMPFSSTTQLFRINRAGRYTIQYKAQAAYTADVVTAPTFTTTTGVQPTLVGVQATYANSAGNCAYTFTVDCPTGCFGTDNAGIITAMIGAYTSTAPTLATTWFTLIVDELY